MEVEVEETLLVFPLKVAGQARGRNEEISAKKQDKNEGKQPVKLGCRRCHVTIRPRSGRIQASGFSNFFFKRPCQSGQELDGYAAGFLKNHCSPEFFIFSSFGRHKLLP